MNRGRGQPPYEPTEADRTTVQVMVACGLKHEDIAACLGTEGIDDKTMRKHFRRELDIGVAKVNALCGQGIVRAMQNGEAWALCFWAKTRMGWRETSHTILTGADGGPIAIVDAILDEPGDSTRAA